MAENFKYNRIAQEMKDKINKIINDDIDDLDFVSVVDVELTKDLQDAKVFVQSLSSDQEEYVLKVLRKKEGFIKKQIALSMKIRKIPALIFKYDHSLENYNKIDSILNNE